MIFWIGIRIATLYRSANTVNRRAPNTGDVLVPIEKAFRMVPLNNRDRIIEKKIAAMSMNLVLDLSLDNIST